MVVAVAEVATVGAAVTVKVVAMKVAPMEGAMRVARGAAAAVATTGVVVWEEVGTVAEAVEVAAEEAEAVAAVGRDAGSMVVEETGAVTDREVAMVLAWLVEEAELGRGEAEAVVVGIVEALLARMGALPAEEMREAEEGGEEVARNAVELAEVRLVAVGREELVMVVEEVEAAVVEVEALEAVAMVGGALEAAA